MTKEAVAVNVEVAIEVKPLGKSLIGNRPFPELGIVELKRILGTTIKHDDTNKIVTFACLLSAYTETAQFNILFIAPSGSGKSYVAIEVAAFFPEVDVKDFGHCSPTSFFHDVGIYDETKKATIVDLSRKILIFLDQPQTLLRPQHTDGLADGVGGHAGGGDDHHAAVIRQRHAGPRIDHM